MVSFVLGVFGIGFIPELVVECSYDVVVIVDFFELIVGLDHYVFQKMERDLRAELFVDLNVRLAFKGAGYQD